MKKLVLLLLGLVLCIGTVGCDNGNNNRGNLEGNLEDILANIYENAKVDESFKEFVENGLYTTEITSENVGYFLGKEGLEFESGIASEPMISISAYSLCLVRVKDGTDIAKMKQEIKENADPRKWICVGVDPQNVIVDNVGDVIILLMSNYELEALHNSFLSLGK
ncbi:MAG: hypothetical protein WC958_03415 [Dehalococcoidales bacterium]